ncbi:MAG: WD40/YVTN/BNR-like repeat-containing protein, partial [bacterium]
MKVIIFLLTALLLIFQGIIVKAERWEPVSLVTEETLEAGFSPGGEGGQWPQALTIDNNDGSLLFFGTDVGGIYRSINGGEEWEPVNIGYTPRGNCGFAIDPNNHNRVLAVGGNSGPGSYHGIYLSTNKGESWEHVLSADISGYRDFREQIIYDPSSYDEELGYTKVAYWSRIE